MLPEVRGPLRSPRGEAHGNVGVDRAVGSPALDTGRYQHAACTNTEIFAEGNILALAAIAVVRTRVPIRFCKRSRRLLGMKA
jgi:hypothetical protein